MARLLLGLTLAAFETTLVSLPLIALTSFGVPWPLLLLALLLGWLADGLTLRLPPRLDRPVLGAGALAAALLLICWRLGLGPLGGLAALLPGAESLGLAYGLALVGLFLYWRGTRLLSSDSLEVSALFGRGAAVLIATLLLAPLLGQADAASPPILAHIVAFISLGLLAMALAHAEDDQASAQRFSWRWLFSLGLAIGAVVLAGLLIAALLGGGHAIEAAQRLLGLLVLPFALLGGLVAYLLITFLGEPLGRLLRMIMAQMHPLQVGAQAPQAVPSPGADQGMIETITRLADTATYLMALIPLAILLLAILLLRRRARRRRPTDEERESLGVAASLAGDLRDLLGRLRNPFAARLDGLRAALAALRGDAPSLRVRRAYIRLLLRLEERERPRPPAQTPAEFALAAAAAAAPQAVAALTGAYERARYDPAGASLAEAAAAEAAFDALK
jgi:uncharacterized integral membrane protein